MDEIEMKYKILKNIILVTKLIYIMKEQLLTSNSNHQKVVDQYKKLLHKEQELYNLINKNSSIMLEFMNYLEQRYNIEDFEFDLDYFSTLEENIVYKRIFNKLSEYVFFLPMEQNLEVSDEFTLDSIENSRLINEIQLIRKKIFINKQLESDYLNVFLYVLSGLKSKYLNFSSEITKIQYDIMFVFSEDEKILDSGILHKKVDLSSKLMSDCIGISDNIYEEIKFDLVDLLIFENLNISLWDNLSEENQKNKTIREILLHSILISAFSLLEKETYEKEIAKIKLLVNLYTDDTNPKNDIINEIDKNIDKIREVYRVITLRKTKKI